MSSTYRILCVSHDPAISFGEYHSGGGGRELAVSHVQNVAEADESSELFSHRGCDLLIGRYSYPLVEVGCARHGLKQVEQHREVEWIDADQLRLFAALAQFPVSANPEMHKIVQKARGWCWSPSRLNALRYELDIPTLGESAPCEVAGDDPNAGPCSWRLTDPAVPIACEVRGIHRQHRGGERVWISESTGAFVKIEPGMDGHPAPHH